MRRLAGVAGACLLYSRSLSFESRAIHSGIHRAFFVLGGMTLVSTNRRGLITLAFRLPSAILHAPTPYIYSTFE
jgi:hypothetical protein